MNCLKFSANLSTVMLKLCIPCLEKLIFVAELLNLLLELWNGVSVNLRNNQIHAVEFRLHNFQISIAVTAIIAAQLISQATLRLLNMSDVDRAIVFKDSYSQIYALEPESVVDFLVNLIESKVI